MIFNKSKIEQIQIKQDSKKIKNNMDINKNN